MAPRHDYPHDHFMIPVEITAMYWQAGRIGKQDLVSQGSTRWNFGGDEIGGPANTF
jgi:hypothetical protein